MIRWKRFKAIAEILVAEMLKESRAVNLSLSTDLPDEVISAVSFSVGSGNPIDILFNARRCKEESMIIEALIHELAHVMTGNNGHDNSWRMMVETVTQKFSTYNNLDKKYGRRNKNNVHDSSEKERNRITGEEDVGDYCQQE